MKMVRIEAPSLRDYIVNTAPDKTFSDPVSSLVVADLNRGSCLDGRAEDLTGRSVLVATTTQMTAALALIELDGRARRLTILPPNIGTDHLRHIIASADIDAVIVDSHTPAVPALDLAVRAVSRALNVPAEERLPARFRTEWLLLTSGTTGAPKLVVHTLADLTAPMTTRSRADGAAVWGTFYDIRRYGGLQIFLRAVLGGASLVLSSADEPIGQHLNRLAQRGVTHLSGTPSHWRRALLSPSIHKIAPRYVRLSGEIADQAILDALRSVFPDAIVGHAFASTEAGVAFDVNDGLAGFPIAFVDRIRDGVEMKVLDGSLRIRSSRTASGYIGSHLSLSADNGFIDTGDIVECRGERYYFVGRNDGVVNVGGLKVHPEEVEAVINRHHLVRMSLVQAKNSPITGSILIADVVLKPEVTVPDVGQLEIKQDLLRHCVEYLPRYKIPADLRLVTTLPVAATGKLSRRYG
jgi:acyl-coenzyme A synthetase/AMP-(fatty) acid ligase